MYEIQVLMAAANNDLPALQQFLNTRTDRNSVKLGRYPDIDCQEDGWGNTPLHLAVLSGHPAAAQMLLNYGANPHATNDRGLNPFQNRELFFGGGFEEQYMLEQAQATGQPAPFDPYGDNFCYYQ